MKRLSNDIIREAAEKNCISEQEILLIKNRMNRGEVIDLEPLFENYGIRLTAEQDKKGIDYLLNLYKTPRGVERKNNPFGYREIDTLENFDHFELVDFYDCGKYGHHFYLPVYRCCGRAGHPDFEYYFNGEVNIIG